MPKAKLRAVWFSDLVLKTLMAITLSILLLFRFLAVTQMDSITKSRLLIGGYEMMLCFEERKERKEIGESPE